MFWQLMKRHLSLIYSIYLRRIKRWWGIYDTERLELELFGIDRAKTPEIMTDVIISDNSDGCVVPSGVTGPNNGDAERGPDGVRDLQSHRFFDFILMNYYRFGSYEPSFRDTGCRGTDGIQGPLEYKTK